MGRLNKTSAGFTLMEVMVAMAIMAIVLVGIMHVFSNALGGIGRSELYTEGLFVARSVLDTKLLDPELLEGTESGTQRTYFEWELNVHRRPTASQLQLMDSAAAGETLAVDWLEEESPLAIYEVSILVTWPMAAYPGQLTLTTLSARVLPSDEEEEEE